MPHLIPPRHDRDRNPGRTSALLERPTQRRWGSALLTLLAAAIVLGGLIRLATDNRVVEVVSFAEANQDLLPVAAAMRASADK